MMLCVYCGENKNEDEATREHVIPRSIGGNLIPDNPFILTRVCKRCNNVCGTYVDAEYTKSVFANGYIAAAYWKQADIRTNPTLPLTFMGRETTIVSPDGRVCDMWLGPTGDKICHFHHPYPSGLLTPPTIELLSFKRYPSIDRGYAILFFRTNNPEWYHTVIHSFINKFKKSDLYFGSGPNLGDPFKDIPLELREFHQYLLDYDEPHTLRLELDPNSGARFMAKIALGLGALFLNDSFALSKSANNLRSMMWSKDAKERGSIAVRGAGMFSEQTKFLDWFGWDKTHIILMNIADTTLFLSTILFGEEKRIICMSNDPTHWQGKMDKEMIYVIAPFLQAYVGPLDIGEYVGWKDNAMPSPRLDALKERMDARPPAPPFMI